ncbi:MAG: patatin-like protein [Alphaproteobacteria bacterium]|nr:patatin-like protein [Alphaproteobacteria bacterium]MDE2041887.1 patatin-like protein [Alphaproteobacteria bacterium]MDE2339653.1 patatin-like protein [Alphaproteobacteria bacterium]
MHEKELRLALICYGGISLAVYMHGITKEIWNLARASQGFRNIAAPQSGTPACYHGLLQQVEQNGETRLRVLVDIIAGASAGGINGIFLGQAIATGQSLEPLTQLWLDYADIDALLDPDAKRSSPLSSAWSVPIASRLMKGRDDGEEDISPEAHHEVRDKLARFIRSRWFAPPFGGVTFTNMLLDSFEAMRQRPDGARLLPPDQPLDLFVTVTDFYGFKQQLSLNSPAFISETEHRRVLGYNDAGEGLGDAASLAFGARATASFPGAFPPFTTQEMQEALRARHEQWPEREAFLRRHFGTAIAPEDVVLIDGAVLTNAPFRPAIDALKDRPARREVDRRFVYIDPTPGGSIIPASLGERTRNPGFFPTLFGALSGIPREQPIRDSIEALNARSHEIARTNQIVESLRADVETSITRLIGATLLLDFPSPRRLRNWTQRAQYDAIMRAGYSYPAYAQTKLAVMIERMARLCARITATEQHADSTDWEKRITTQLQLAGATECFLANGSVNPHMAATFQTYDLDFRIRRLRFVARRLDELRSQYPASAHDAMRVLIYDRLAEYLEREGLHFYAGLGLDTPEMALSRIAALRALPELDTQTEDALAPAIAACAKPVRRSVLLAWLGYPFYDIATLPLLRASGTDEFNPIKIDRIAPDDAQTLRPGPAHKQLKGHEFHNFGAFFSRAYRENDYLWGRLHGADRLIDIVLSSARDPLSETLVHQIKYEAFRAILDEEKTRLRHIPILFESLERDMAALRAKIT